MNLVDYSFLKITEGVSSLSRDGWNRLVGQHAPHLSHEFLSALERHRCLGDRVGWHASPWVVTDPNGDLVAALPLYQKDNSFGEFVFDWAWADAYQRHGMAYYPKWVVASPFTPATGKKMLHAESDDAKVLEKAILQSVLKAAADEGISSVHFLFTNEAGLHDSGLIDRIGCQFHWENRGYRDFEDFLSALTAKRRKEVLRERRKVLEAGVTVRRRAGCDVSPAEWELFHRLYLNTFERHSNFPALTSDFFQSIGSMMGERLLLVDALVNGEMVAAGFFMVGDDTLYGRYWGAFEEIPALHFEVCFYQGIEFAIEQGLRIFEPGAQGEHKISRGFLPTRTHSFHWIANRGFREAIARHVALENQQVERYIEACEARSPYRSSEC